jgi:hypothetical protein
MVTSHFNDTGGSWAGRSDEEAREPRIIDLAPRSRWERLVWWSIYTRLWKIAGAVIFFCFGLPFLTIVGVFLILAAFD